MIAHEDLETERWDVNQALLQADIGRVTFTEQADIGRVTFTEQADIDRVTFTEQAEGFVVPGKEGWVIRLNKSLYGLRQAPQLWNRCLDEFLDSEGFVSSPADACV